MSQFNVTEIIDGDTFDVSPEWKWNGQTGRRVRPTGFDAPEIGSPAGQIAKDRLARLIKGKQVDLRTAYRIDRGRLVCDVYYKNRKLEDYFKSYQ
jgi:endonuclease YncB( thermonuclease family)